MKEGIEGRTCHKPKRHLGWQSGLAYIRSQYRLEFGQLVARSSPMGHKLNGRQQVFDCPHSVLRTNPFG
jgi:hypothetical protein